jgi:glycerophosphoryl diester phosphodiesterase
LTPVLARRLAHRGDWRRAPENTIPAFQAALDIPACSGLEFDVRASAEGVPVVIHDETLARVRGRPERVDALTADVLMDIGIPTLADALGAISHRAFLDVELKVDIGPAVVEVLAAGRGPELHNAAVSSFQRGVLERIGHLAPTWPRWLNVHALGWTEIEAALDIGCRGVAVEWHGLNARSIRAAHAAGLEVIAWTVRRRATFDRLARLGVSTVCVEAAALDG